VRGVLWGFASLKGGGGERARSYMNAEWRGEVKARRSDRVGGEESEIEERGEGT
jgi:hypothetical protein